MVHIIEYGSTLYVGMAQKKYGCPIKRVQYLMFKTLLWMYSEAFMSHTSHSRVFLSTTRLLALIETITGVPKRQFAKRPNRLSSFFLS